MQEQINFTLVRNLKRFVKNEAEKLQARPFTKRSLRQLTDARRFLDMLNEPKYANIEKISDLKKAITNERKKLQDISASFDKLLPGYQLSMFENLDSITDEQREYIRVQKILLDEEVHWLHKCLGICHNKEYFRC